MNKMIRIPALLVWAALASGCSVSELALAANIEGGQRTGSERFVDENASNTENRHLSELVAGVWVDPNGCDHWIIDDGVEGYLSARLSPDGRPVCSGVAPPNTATGPFNSGTLSDNLL